MIHPILKLFELFGEGVTKLTNRRKVISLRFKLTILLVCAFCTSAIIYFGLQAVSNYFIERYYLNDNAVSERTFQYLNSFENYVRENNISSYDTDKVATWAKQEQYVYLTIYKNDELIFESGQIEDSTLEESDTQNPENEVTDSSNILNDTFFPVQFADGKVAVSIIDFSEVKWYNFAYAAILLFAFIIFSIIILSYNQYITKRIISFSNRVKDVEHGKLDMHVRFSGNDELSLLTDNVDKMRISIINRLQKEKNAWQANCDLITAMSHDIRTPLTALMGYLDIIDKKQYKSQEQYERYLKNSKEKALQLKELSDKLFQYFLVFGQPELSANLIKLDAVVLLQQIIGEHVAYLQDNGFEVELSLFEQKSSIMGDVTYIRRVFDNLFSNIEKYADKSGRVIIFGEIFDACIHLSFINSILDNSFNEIESTKIGFKTCEKIIEQMKGTFVYREEKQTFIVEIKLPLAL